MGTQRWLEILNTITSLRKILIFFIVIMLALMPIQLSAKSAMDGEFISNGKLSLSQLPGPAFAFGQNIIRKSDAYVLAIVDQLNGCHTEFTEIVPRFLYGLRDDLSLYLVFPVAIKFAACNARSSGLQDMRIQLEYAFFDKKYDTGLSRATVVGAMFFPTGSTSKIPATGFGSPSFFGGFTLAHFGIDWYLYTSHGVLLTTKRDGTRFGNVVRYQGGVGRSYTVSPGLLCAFIIELNGIYAQKSRRNYCIDYNSGGNTILCGPTMNISTKRFSFQAAVEFPILQQLNGLQDKTSYVFSINVGWKI